MHCQCWQCNGDNVYNVGNANEKKIVKTVITALKCIIMHYNGCLLK